MKEILLVFILTFLAISGFSQNRRYQLPENVKKDQFSSSTIIVKLKNQESKALLGKEAGGIAIINVKRALMHLEKTSKSHPLDNIYKVDIPEGSDVIEAINKLLESDEVVYAEPYFNHRPLFIPNDPAANPNGGQQTWLSVIKAYDAWTIEKGDESIVIGILDSGVQPDHQDLIDQIAYNFNDPINGIDDDNDGLVDNFAGWDIANNDNNPYSDTDSHGTEVAGISSAKVNNGEGLAGIGFNSKFLPIKIFESGTNSFNNGYEAIALAADLGCQIINLSWGSANSYSQFGQDVINYAVLEKDVVIVAAAGNTSELLNFYPASFDNVLSVGATTMGDEKTFFSTFSYHIDMMAPGEKIYSTTNDSTYISNGLGTSYSSPMVAGAAALVRARFPNLTAQQVMERMRVTSDDIYATGSNSNYNGQLGKGRLNMLKALTDISSPAMRITQMGYSNGLGQKAYNGDTLSIIVEITNYLNSVQGGLTKLSSSSPFVTIIQSDFSIPGLSSINSLSNMSNPYSVILSDNLPPEEELVFRLDFTANNYKDFQYFSITTSPSRVEIDNNKLSLTIGAKGDLGYDLPGFNNGIGVKYEGVKIADNIGLILSTNKDAVSDNAPINLTLNTKDQDFQVVENIKEYRNGMADIDVRSGFSIMDSIRIEQKFLSDTNAEFIIQEYRIINTGNQSLTNLNVSIFADWNLGNKDLNTADWDGTSKLGYIYDGNTYVGMAFLSNQDSLYSAVNNRNFNGNIADIPTLLNDSVKFSHSSQGIFKTTAGTANGGNDVSHFLGGTINLLDVNETEKVVFVMVAGHSLIELQQAITTAKDFYNQYNTNPPIIQITDTCPNEPAVINPSSGVLFNFYSDAELTNLLFSGEEFTTPNITISTPYFVVNKDQDYFGETYRIIARPKPAKADFSISPNPLLLDETGNDKVQISDNSIDGQSWQWDFGNGFTGTTKNPITNYTKKGFYDISLSVTNDIGCSEMVIKSLEVENRSNKPEISNQFICKGDTVNLVATNATAIDFYADINLTQLVYSGNNFNSNYYKDTTFYVVSRDSVYSSNIAKVNIDVNDVTAKFEYAPDTTDLSSPTLISLNSKSKNEALFYWYANNELIGVNTDITFDYDNLNAFEVKLVAESANGCFDTSSQVITRVASQTPTFESKTVCLGADVLINPSGDFLQFYADANLTDLRAKGSGILLENIQVDTTIYITSNQDYLESAPLAVTITISNIKAQFTPSVNPLNFKESNEVLFTDNSTGAISWIWLVNKDTVSFLQSPTILFEGIGNYTIQLTVMDNIGCPDSTNLDFQVINITGLNEFEDLKFYPNPVTDYLKIESSSEIEATIIDLQGKIVNSGNGKNIVLETVGLKKGIYFLQINEGKIKRWFKIAKY